jgi:hypothetical protein
MQIYMQLVQTIEGVQQIVQHRRGPPVRGRWLQRIGPAPAGFGLDLSKLKFDDFQICSGLKFCGKL